MAGALTKPTPGLDGGNPVGLETEEPVEIDDPKAGSDDVNFSFFSGLTGDIGSYTTCFDLVFSGLIKGADCFSFSSRAALLVLLGDSLG